MPTSAGNTLLSKMPTFNWNRSPTLVPSSIISYHAQWRGVLRQLTMEGVLKFLSKISKSRKVRNLSVWAYVGAMMVIMIVIANLYLSKSIS